MRKIYQFAILGVLGVVMTMLAMGLNGQEAEAAVMNNSQSTDGILVDLLSEESQIFVEALGFECHVLPSFDASIEYCTLNLLTETSPSIEIIRENHPDTFQYTTLIFDGRTEYGINTTSSVARIGIIRAKESGIIQHMTIMPEADQVTVGDLVTVLGQPTIQRFYNQTYFMWVNSGITASAFSSSVEVSNSLPIWRISFVPHTLHAPA